MIEQGSTGIEFRLDRGQHVVDRGHFDDGFAELLTIASVSQSLVVSRL